MVTSRRSKNRHHWKGSKSVYRQTHTLHGSIRLLIQELEAANVHYCYRPFRIIRHPPKKSLPTYARLKMDRTQQRIRKVHWSRESEKKFILMCYDKYLASNLLTSSFTSQTYQHICDMLNGTNNDGNVYSVRNLRCKFKNLKKHWKLLNELRNKSGFGWDFDKETVVAPADVLEKIYEENRDARGIVGRGLPCFDLCAEMFAKNTADGRHAMSSGGRRLGSQPTSETQPNAASNVTPSGESMDDEEVEGGTDDGSNGTPLQPSYEGTSYNREPGLGNAHIPRREQMTPAQRREAAMAVAVEEFTAYVSERRRRKPDAELEFERAVEHVRQVPDLTPQQIIGAIQHLKYDHNRAAFGMMTPTEQMIFLQAFPM